MSGEFKSGQLPPPCRADGRCNYSRELTCRQIFGQICGAGGPPSLSAPTAVDDAYRQRVAAERAARQAQTVRLPTAGEVRDGYTARVQANAGQLYSRTARHGTGGAAC